MDKMTQIIKLPLWLYDDLKKLAEEDENDNLVDVIAKLVTQALERRKPPTSPPTSAFQNILARATDLEITDLSEQHDHYLYGIEKT